MIDFIESYNQYSHRVNKVKIGFPISHDPQSHEPIHWKGKGIVLSVQKIVTDDIVCSHTNGRTASHDSVQIWFRPL